MRGGQALGRITVVLGKLLTCRRRHKRTSIGRSAISHQRRSARNGLTGLWLGRLVQLAWLATGEPSVFVRAQSCTHARLVALSECEGVYQSYKNCNHARISVHHKYTVYFAIKDVYLYDFE
jgi:hypothetical protein